jgi:regulator of protease activity HflC (stomatin/prohibitin superfamily)
MDSNGSRFFDRYGDAKPALYITVAGGIIAIVLFFALLPFTVVEPGEAAVVVRNGRINRVLDGGPHLVMPLFERVVTMSTATQKENVVVAAASKDLQTVNAEVAINYNLNADRVGEIYTAFGYSVLERLVLPAVQEGVKAATAQFTAEELISRRGDVKVAIESLLIERLEPNFVHVSGVSLTDFNFSEDFSRAIEKKVVAAQNALTEENNTLTEKFKADQRIEQARGEAEAIRIQAQSINSQGGAAYVQLKWIERWNGELPTWVSGTSPTNIMNLPDVRK